MKKELIKQIEQQMSAVLNNAQNAKLHEVLEHEFYAVEIIPKQTETELTQAKGNVELLADFLAAKQVEGCSARSICYYKSTLENAIKILEKPLNQIETEDLRIYLSEYQKKNNAGKQTIDNIRRILSSFFTWLEDEDYILIDAEEQVDMTKKYGVMQAPTLVVVNGDEVKRYPNASNIQKYVDEN